MTPKQIALGEALSAHGLRELPRELQQDDVWIDALALVTRSTGVQDYVYVTNDNADGIPIVKKDYGICAAIARVDKLYPINYLDRKRIPDLRSNKAIVEFLAKNGYAPDKIEALLSKEDKSEEQAKKDRAKVKLFVNKVAIKLAKEMKQEQIRCENIGNVKTEDDGEE